MSWDVSFIKCMETYKNIAEILEDAVPLDLGSVDETHLAISRVFEGTDWSDPSWGIWESPNGVIEFSIGSAKEVASFTLHVRADDTVVPRIVELAKQNEWQALDCSTGDMLEQSETPKTGLQGWRAYRDHLFNGIEE